MTKAAIVLSRGLKCSSLASHQNKYLNSSCLQLSVGATLVVGMLETQILVSYDILAVADGINRGCRKPQDLLCISWIHL